jgi:hypothetical protein
MMSGLGIRGGYQKTLLVVLKKYQMEVVGIVISVSVKERSVFTVLNMPKDAQTLIRDGMRNESLKYKDYAFSLYRRNLK